MVQPIVQVRQLNKRERAKLEKVMLGYGNRKKVSDATGLHGTTLDKAVDGGKLEIDTLNSIRTYLQNMQS